MSCVVSFVGRVAFTAQRIMIGSIKPRSIARIYLTQLILRMVSIMETSRQFRKRPQSEIKSASRRAPTYGHRRSRSTGGTSAVSPEDKSHRKISTRESTAFAEFMFFDDDDDDDGPGPGSTESVTKTRPLPVLPEEESLVNLKLVGEVEFGTSVGHRTRILKDASPPGSSLPPSFPECVDTSKMSLEELTHPSGSPVLKQKFVSNDENLTALACSHELEDDHGVTAKHTARSKERTGIRSNDRLDTTKDVLHTIRDSVLATLEEPTLSVVKHVAGPGHIEEQNTKPNIITIGKGNDPGLQLRRQSANEQRNQQQQAYKDAQNPSIRRKSLPASAKIVPESSTTTLESTQEWLNSLADEESEAWKNDTVAGTIEILEHTSSATKKPTPHPQSISVRSNLSSQERTRSLPTKPKPLRSNNAKEVAPNKQSRNMRLATPGPSARPASPPLRRNVAAHRKPLEKQDRDSSTLYNTSCWTDKSYLKTLLKGPVLEFRVDPHGEPFLINVSQEMLKHFCGEKHIDRLIRDHSLRPEQRGDEDEEATILVFPGELVDATAIMRIVRYMRRCCMCTTTLTKPHFQLHAPPSLEANIETIRACNMLGLYADARRLQYFLTDKKIPGGRLTMEDVETIWEGYDGGLRDSAYTDALLTHLVYNVLGSDSVDREDIMVLLEQEEFAGLKELLGMELGIKKRAAESREMFQMRKESEREDRVNQKNGKGRRLSKLEKIRASRGPMIQGRLLRMLSYDALFEPDLTAETRYKPRPGLGRGSASTPDLMDRTDGDEELVSVGSLYQGALKEIKGAITAAERIQTLPEGVSDVEEETSVLSTLTPSRTAAPTLLGQKHATSSLAERQVQDWEDVRPAVPRKDYHPNGAGTRRTAEPLRSWGKAMHHQNAAVVPETGSNANVRPLDSSQRTRMYATTNAPSSFGSNVGQSQPRSYFANGNYTHSIASGTSTLRSRTDPWWGTLGYSPPLAKKKSPNRLKQMWNEVRKIL